MIGNIWTAARPASMLYSAVQGLTHEPDELRAAADELQRYEREVAEPQSMKVLLRQAKGKRESLYGLFILCGCAFAGMLTASNLGGTAGALAFGLWLVPIPAVLWYLSITALGKLEAAEKRAPIDFHLGNLKRRYEELAAKHAARAFDTGTVASVLEVRTRVVMGGVVLKKR